MKGTLKQKIGTVFLALVSLGLILGSFGMILANPNSKEAMEFAPLHLGKYVHLLGLIKLVFAVLLFFPRSRNFAALVLTGYLGGALMANLIFGEFPVGPILFIIVLWSGMELKTKDFLKLACTCGSCVLCKVGPSTKEAEIKA